MKKIILAGALLLAAFTNSAFAGEGTANPLVTNAFKASFSNVENVHWSMENKMYKAEFTNQGERYTAFFNGDGTLLATGHYILLEKLPYALQRSLIRRTITGSIMEVFEIQSDDKVDYYATVKHGDGQIVLKSAITTWSVFKRI